MCVCVCVCGGGGVIVTEHSHTCYQAPVPAAGALWKLGPDYSYFVTILETSVSYLQD